MNRFDNHLFDAQGHLDTTYPYPIQLWQFGDSLRIVALGGEVVVDYSLRLKKELGGPANFIAAYANDVMAYIPSLRVLKEGGYEGGGAMVYYGLHGPWDERVEEMIIETVHEMAVTKTDKYDNHPVVQVAWDDAVAYAKWAGKRLPTEAEWEFAARGGKEGQRFTWGDDPPSETNIKANIWQGEFPYKNKTADGYELSAPVKAFPPNAYGLYGMIGNVWEWCGDWYRADYYETLAAKGGVAVNPQGPATSLDPNEPYTPKRVQRGGSFLCNSQYCASYRPSARMSSSPDTGQNHVGFRCVMTQEQWLARLQKP